MKCGACGAIGSSSDANCEFCGANLARSAEATQASEGRPAPLLPTFDPSRAAAYVQDSVTIIKDLSQTPSGSFNVVAFLFPVSYLWGYGSKDVAFSVATVLLVPQLLAQLVFWVLDLGIFDTLYNVTLIATSVWYIYVSWMVSTRTAQLVERSKPFDWAQGIVSFIAFMILSSIIGLYNI